MARKPQKGQDAPLPFPLAGLDSSDPHDKQRPLTTRDGENVQSFDMLQNRARGGSRPGLTKYVGDTVTGLLNKPVQCLTTVVTVSNEAMLDDDSLFGGNVGFGPGGGSGGGGGTGGDGGGVGPPVPPTPGGDLIPDGSSDRFRRRKPPGGRLIRNHGSGVRPTRNGKKQSQPPIARPDTYGTLVGAASSAIDVLGNDFYLGEPNFTLLSIPSPINGSSIALGGSGTGKRVVFTPPSTGDGPYVFVVPYRLTAKGNKGSSDSVLTIEVTNQNQPYPPGTYTGRVNSVELGDGFLGVQITYNGNPLPSTNLFFSANGPGSGSTEPGVTNVFVNTANNFASILPGLGITILITGPSDPPPGFIGTLGLS